ncbi:unnamed protein product [Heligmosomoides polygyrus]|uniref:Uncharacterized protein n=1 Tax=Heligmosomoides polygyrus TaxID=6339 RepID=A0A3P8BRI1_HELPZ|nr:unnamed protein product [Heligmosomoides polygyrus]
MIPKSFSFNGYAGSSIPEGSASNRYFDDVIPMGECEVRDALLGEVKRHRYWRTSAFKRMQFERLEMLSCLHYVLESFTEARSTSEATEAIAPGQLFDHATSSVTDPWDYEVTPSRMFVDQVRVLEMPGSSTINPCSACNSEGTYHCFHCRGYGTDKCNFCRGTGMKSGVAHPAVYTHPMVATFPHVSFANTGSFIRVNRELQKTPVMSVWGGSGSLILTFPSLCHLSWLFCRSHPFHSRFPGLFGFLQSKQHKIKREGIKKT